MTLRFQCSRKLWRSTRGRFRVVSHWAWRNTTSSRYNRQSSRYDAAIPVLTKALEINSRAFSSCFALGVAQYNVKQIQPAIESFRRAVLLNEKSINANLWLGIALRQTSRPDAAESYLRRADQLAESKLPDAHWQLALLFNQLKRYKEAADELEIFLKLQPDARDAELIKKLIKRLREQSVAEKP